MALIFPIASSLDVFEARRGVQAEAARAGFPRRACAELAVVVSELGSNIVKHAGRGEILIACGDSAERGPYLDVAARDEGPQIADLEVALRDGCAGAGPIDPMRLLGRGGIGGGLGAVVRFTDRFEHVPHPHGKTIRVRRFLVGPR